MKRILLILVTVIIAASMILIGGGCKSAEALQPAVVEFIGSDFEITLPENWEGGTKDELDSVASELEDLGQKELAEKIEANKIYLLFFGYNSEDAAQGDNVSNLTITGEPAEFLSLEEYMELAYTNLAEKFEKAEYKFTITDQEVISLGNYKEVGRTIFEQTVEDAKTGGVQYIIKHESDLWTLTFTTDLEEFDKDIETFDNTFKTFKILD